MARMEISAYEKFDAATRNMTAQALIFDGRAVGRIVIKHGNAANAFVQVWGAPMATARATGYGYDRNSAAVMAAISKLAECPNANDAIAYEAFNRIRAIAADWNGGTRYENALEAAGFHVSTIC
jgi:hypothetical protein